MADGLVETLARPGGNVTGLSSLTLERIGKCLELLSQVVPGRRRIAVLWQPIAVGERTAQEMVKDAGEGARTLGMQIDFVEVRDASELERAFSDLARMRVGALAVWTTPMLVAERARLVDLAVKNRVAAIYTLREFVDAGGLMAYGHSQADLNRRAATYVDKILRGAKPADLPVEQPTKFELVLNLKAARQIGLAIPQALLLRADDVVK